MSDNPRIEKLLSSVLPVAGLTWATRRPLGVGGVVGIGAVGVDDVIEVVTDRDAEVRRRRCARTRVGDPHPLAEVS